MGNEEKQLLPLSKEWFREMRNITANHYFSLGIVPVDEDLINDLFNHYTWAYDGNISEKEFKKLYDSYKDEDEREAGDASTVVGR